MSNLYIHIGHYKTGTTALQVFLASNKAELSSKGINYVDDYRENAKHSILGLSVLSDLNVDYLMYGYESQESYKELWTNLLSNISNDNNSENNIISSEEFIRISEFEGGIERLKTIKEIADKYNVEIKVIVYLREPSEHLHSWFNQLNKMNVFNSTVNHEISSFHHSLNFIDRIHYDYEYALAPWIKVFGNDNLIYKKYYGSIKSPDYIYQDFLGIFDLDLDDTLTIPEGKLNPRIDDTVMYLMGALARKGFHQASIKHLLKQWNEFKPPNKSDTQNPEVMIARAKLGTQWLSEITSSSLEFEGDISTLFSDSIQNEELKMLNAFLYSELLLTRQSIRVLERKIDDVVKLVRHDDIQGEI